jgi:acetylornithine deacetylase/succinyl-diaminopimelate desuccinylase-like protein
MTDWHARHRAEDHLDPVRQDGGVTDRRLVDDLLAFAAIPSPTFAEGERLAWLERRLAVLPGHSRRDDAGNLIWSWRGAPGGGDDARPELALLAHVDTVFGAGEDLGIREDGGTLRGAGIGDNAAGVVVTLHVVGALLGEGALRRPGAVAFTVGEEGLGNLRGAHAAVAGLRPRAVVAVEGHGLDEVALDAVGSLRARVRVHGPGGHSWGARGTPSAIHALLGAGAALAQTGTADAPVNVGRIEGGGAINQIAGSAELTIERRSLDQADLDAFAARLAALTVPSPLSIAVETLGERPGGRQDPDHPLVHAVRAVRTELGLPWRLDTGSSDANAALAAGVPALVLGCSRGGEMHTHEEHLDAASLATGADQLDRLLRALLG